MLGGLSPRVRGNRDQTPAEIVAGRSIPACAGEPKGERVLHCHCRVYPRVCGGTVLTAAAWASWGGLSPRVRGNPTTTHRDGWTGRSIPACAGEPNTSLGLRLMRKVYPRVCGGTGVTEYKKGEDNGLSPRVRGNRWLALLAYLIFRSIPACAGEPI